MKQMKDGIIRVDTERGDIFGFKSSIFSDGSFMYKKDDDIYISMIIVKSGQRRKGHFNRLIKTINELGYTIKIPTPMWNMEKIVIRKKFDIILEYDKLTNEKIKVWVKKP